MAGAGEKSKFQFYLILNNTNLNLNNHLWPVSTLSDNSGLNSPGLNEKKNRDLQGDIKLC
jgi:hypothetical protein